MTFPGYLHFGKEATNQHLEITRCTLYVAEVLHYVKHFSCEYHSQLISFQQRKRLELHIAFNRTSVSFITLRDKHVTAAASVRYGAWRWYLLWCPGSTTEKSIYFRADLVSVELHSATHVISSSTSFRYSGIKKRT